MNYCSFENLTAGNSCSVCGWVLPRDFPTGLIRECSNQEKQNPGPGTRLKNFLTKWGVTEEWYKSLKEKVGLIPECNCQMRADYMDAVWKGYQEGGWEGAKIEYNRVKDYYSKPR